MSSVATGRPSFRYKSVDLICQPTTFRHQFDQFVRGWTVGAVEVVLCRSLIYIDTPRDPFIGAFRPLVFALQDAGKPPRAILGCESV
jgi:hypothetical protein